MIAVRIAQATRAGRPRRQRGSGQSLVEFALIFPIFVTLVMGVIEFGFVFNAMLSVNYAARDAALAAAEAGDTLGADCVILKAVDDAIGPPTNDDRITTVDIFQASPNGAMLGAPTTYTRGGSTSCTFVDGTTATLPYTQTANGYAETARCNILAGCGGSGSGGSVDNVAVRITYTHTWVTPIRNFIGGGSGGITFDRSSVMRMEPIL